MGYMETLAERIASVTDEQLAGADRRVSNSKCGNDDHIVGTVSTELQRLFCVWQGAKLDQKRAEHAIELALAAGDEVTDELHNSYFGAKREASMLGNIFWHSLRVEHPKIANKGNIGVRAGWNTVWTDSGEIDIGELLSSIHGMMVGADQESDDASTEGGFFATLASLLGRRRDPKTVN